MSTATLDRYRFDHGAQYFTARDRRFARVVATWRERGWVTPWTGRLGVVAKGKIAPSGDSVERLVAVPGMSSLCHRLAGALPDCRQDWQVTSVHWDGCEWEIRSADHSFRADALIVAMPPEQALAFLDSPTVRAVVDAVQMRPCWSAMTLWDKPLWEHWDAAFVNQGPLSWISSQSSKPGQADANAWVLHADHRWSLKHLYDRPEMIADALVQEVRNLPQIDAVLLLRCAAHRWTYAIAGRSLHKGALWYPEQRLAMAGDWCHGSRVEGAWLSGVAAAGRILNEIGIHHH